MRMSERLAAQNNGLIGWRECKRHRWNGNPQRVKDAIYLTCRRCPVSIRKVVPARDR